MSTDLVITILIILGALGVFAAVFFWLVRLSRVNRLDSAQLLQQLNETIATSLNQFRVELNERLRENREALDRSHENVQRRLEHASRVVSGVTEKLSRLEESSKRIFDIGKDITTLQELLRAPKFRGNIGEYLLEDQIKQIIPKEHYRLQYRFKNGELVDAMIMLHQLKIPVDAKFPLEEFKLLSRAKEESERQRLKKNFIRSVKKHINDISVKYIMPHEGTSDFAFMYIPAENVYYETIIKEELGSLLQYAFSKRVIPVSPNSFYAYLRTVLVGLRALQVEKGAREILRYVSALQNGFGNVEEQFKLVGTHIGHAHKSFDKADRAFERYGLLLDNLQAVEKKPALSKGRPLKGESKDGVDDN